MSPVQNWGRRINLLVVILLVYSASTFFVLLWSRGPGPDSDIEIISGPTGQKRWVLSSLSLFAPRKISSLELDEKTQGKSKIDDDVLKERITDDPGWPGTSVRGVSGRTTEDRTPQSPRDRTSPTGDKNKPITSDSIITNNSANSSWKWMLDNIFIAVKTTKRFHQERLKWVLDTWASGVVADKVHVFTDKHDATIDNLNKGVNIVETNCSDQHNRPSLCCKMGVELETFLQSTKNWFCHVDDDNYVNVPLLAKMLSNYSHHTDIYIGRPSLDRPIEVQDRVLNKAVSFWFATGGAGFCISRSLAYRMSPYYSDGAFVNVCERVRLPDDCTVGFVIESILDRKLTVDYRFHSHLEPLSLIKKSSITNQLTLSYGISQDYSRKYRNVVDIDGYYNESDDPTRFKSIHCIIHPDTDWCQHVDNSNRINTSNPGSD